MPDILRSKKLRQEMGELTDASRKIIVRADDEKRKRTDEENSELRKMDSRLDEIEGEIELAEKQERREAKLREPVGEGIRPAVQTRGTEPSDEERQRTNVAEFRKRFGAMGESIARRMPGNPLATSEYRNAFNRYITAPRMSGVSTLTPEESRALSVGTATQGGYTVPQEEFVAELIKDVDDQAVIRPIARTFQVPTAQSLGAPSLTTDASDPDWTTEILVGSEDSSMAFGKRDLHPWPLAKYIKISDKLLRASPLNMDSIVRERLAYKQAVAQSKAFNTGDGNNKPLGIYAPTNSGEAGITTDRDYEIASSSVITPELLITARFALKQGYWANAKWHMHRNWLAAFRKIRTGANNDFIWQPGLTVGAPNTLLDFPYVVDEYAPSVTTVGAGVYAAILGDFSNYWIADALSIRLQRLDELFALTNQVAFIIRSECDAMPVNENAFVRLKATAT